MTTPTPTPNELPTVLGVGRLPPEAIEAAAQAIYRSVNRGHADTKGWDEVQPKWQHSYRQNATAALTAAAPFMTVEAQILTAQAKAEALREAADDLNPQLREYRLGAHEVLTQKVTPHGGDDTRSLQLALVAAKQTQNWLRARASIIEAAE